MENPEAPPPKHHRPSFLPRQSPSCAPPDRFFLLLGVQTERAECQTAAQTRAAWSRLAGVQRGGSVLEGKREGGGGGSGGPVGRTSLWNCAPAVGGRRTTPAGCCVGTQQQKAEDRSSDGNPDTNINTGSHFNSSSLRAPRCYQALGQQTQHGKHQAGPIGPIAGKLEGGGVKTRNFFSIGDQEELIWCFGATPTV